MGVGMQDSDQIHVKESTYEPCLDGIRAVAVLSVLLYHALPELLPCGLAGVTVFFVVSGYLISGIVLSSTREFGFVEFYRKRFLRIVPAAYAVILLTVGVGWVFLRKYEERLELLRSASWASVGAANVYFWWSQGEAGYFGNEGGAAPLLHYWSLSVEEQFYLCLPLVLVLWRRKGIFSLVCLFVPFAVLFVAFFSAVSNPGTSYYLSWTRAPEMMVGVLLRGFVSSSLGIRLTTGSDERRSRWCLGHVAGPVALAGILFFEASFAPSSTPYTPWIALWPSILTALLIFSCLASGSSAEFPVNAFLRSAPMRIVGKMSFSLYLLHWPVVTFLRYWKVPVVPGLGLALTVGVFIGSWVSFQNLESLRYGSWSFWTILPARLAVVLFLFGLTFGLSAWPVSPVVRRSDAGIVPTVLTFVKDPPMFDTYDRKSSADFIHDAASVDAVRELEMRQMSPPVFTAHSTFHTIFNFTGGDGAPGSMSSEHGAMVGLLGDSLAEQLFPFMDEIGRVAGFKVAMWADGACPPLVGHLCDARFLPNRWAGREEGMCGKLRDKAFANSTLKMIDGIVLSAFWSSYFPHLCSIAQLKETFEWLLNRAKRVVVVGEPPKFSKFDPGEFEKLGSWSNLRGDRYAFQSHVWMRHLLQSYPQIVFVDIGAYICNGLECNSLGADGRTNTLFNTVASGHFNSAGERIFARRAMFREGLPAWVSHLLPNLPKNLLEKMMDRVRIWSETHMSGGPG